jgi:Chaperone of endosialidase
MSAYLPPTQIISLFNPYFYSNQDANLTIQQALQTFLPLAGGTMTGMLYAGSGITTSSEYNSGNLTFGGTTNTITMGGTIAATIAMNSTTSTSITLSGNAGGIFLTGTGSSISVANTSASSISSAGGINSNTGFYLNGTLLSLTSLPTTLGTNTASQCLSMNSNGVSIFTAGSLTTNQLKWWNNTNLRTSIRLYRTSDTTPLVLADQIDGSSSTNRQYPILQISSCPNTAGPIAGIAATTADLQTIQFNDSGFGTWNLGLGFSCGFTQPFQVSGYPKVNYIRSDGDAINLCAATSSGTSTAGNILIDGNNSRVLINTMTPAANANNALAVNGWLSCGRNYSAGDSAFNVLDGTNGSTACTMRFGNSLSSNNAFSLTWQPSGGSGSSNNYITFNPYGFSNALTVSCGSQVGIGTNAWVAGLTVATTTSTTIDVAGSGYAYFLKSGGLVSTIGPSSSVAVGIKTSGALLASAGVYTTSDQRIKKDFTELSDSVVSGMLEVHPIMYRYKSQDETVPLQIGYCAQDLIRAGLPHCINIVDDENMHVEDESIDLEGKQFSVDYSKMVCLLHKLVLHQQTLIADLEDKYDFLYNHIQPHSLENESPSNSTSNSEA